MQTIRWKGRVTLPVRITLPLRHRLKILLGFPLVVVTTARTQKDPGRVHQEQSEAVLERPKWMRRNRQTS